MFDADEPISDFQQAVRDRASDSLGSLRYALNSPLKTPPSTRKWHARDEYTSAVSRLKVLLQQYNDSKAAADSASLKLSRDPPHGLLQFVPSSSHHYLPDSDELTQLLNSQFTVVQHLDSQVEFYKDALGSLKKRTELLTQENHALYEQLKAKAVSQVLEDDQRESPKESPRPILTEASYQTPAMSTPYTRGTGRVRFDVSDDEHDQDTSSYYPPTPGGEHPGEPSPTPGREHPGEPQMWWQGGDLPQHATRNAVDDQLFLSPNQRTFILQMQDEVDKIRELHEAKSRHLETLLYSTRDELEDSHKQVAELQNKLRSRDITLEQGGRPALCVRCGHQEAILSSTHGDAMVKTIDKLTSERDELMETLTRQKASLTDVRKREMDAYVQVKKSCELVEQAQLEKAQAIIQVQQLRDESQQQRERHERYTRESHERAAKEQENTKSGFREEIDRLAKKVQSVTDAHAATENQLERVTREKVALSSELDQAKAQIMAHSSEIAKVGEDIQKELTQATIKTTLAEQQMASLKTATQQTNRQREQERVRLNTELSELRRRLDEAQSGWMESKEECIRLTEKLDNANREAKIAAVAHKNFEKARASEVASLNHQATQREQQLSALLQETENRNTQARSELEHLLESQLQVSTRLKDECRNLAHQLQELSLKSRAELRDAVSENEKMKAQLSSVTNKNKALEANNENKDRRIDKLASKLQQSEANAKKNVQQMYELLMKQNALLKDRQTLTREVEYMRQQFLQSRRLECVTPAVDTESNASNQPHT